jgi:hypothetical protein
VPIPDPDKLTGIDDADLDAWMAEEDRRAVDRMLDEAHELRGTAEGLKAMAATMLEDARAMIARADLNMEKVREWADRTGESYIRHPLGNWRLTERGGTPSIELVVDAELLPLAYQRITVSADKRAIQDALDPGGELADPATGTVLARMAERGGKILKREKVKPTIGEPEAEA